MGSVGSSDSESSFDPFDLPDVDSESNSDARRAAAPAECAEGLESAAATKRVEAAAVNARLCGCYCQKCLLMGGVCAVH
jgi:hypothetical protein